MTPDTTKAGGAEAPRVLHPYCNACGWRKGGVDSWNGKACKCGEYAPPIETRMPAPEQKQ